MEERAVEDRELTLAITRTIAGEEVAAGAAFELVYLPARDDLRAGPIATDFLAAECTSRDWLCLGPGPRIVERWPKRRQQKRQFQCHDSPELAALIAEVAAEQIAANWPDRFPAGFASIDPWY